MLWLWLHSVLSTELSGINDKNTNSKPLNFCASVRSKVVRSMLCAKVMSKVSSNLDAVLGFYRSSVARTW